MLRHLLNILFLNIIISVIGYCQETIYGPGYQTMIMSNPALSGNSGVGVLRMSYFNFYPGHGYDFHSVYTSFDSYFSKIHGGAGIYVSDDYLGGIINDIRGGLSYSYFLQAEKDLYINGGLSFSFYHRGFNFGKAVLPDQIDPLGGISLPSSEVLLNDSRTIFDVGTGVVVISGKYFGGLAILHLTQPYLGTAGSAEDKLKRKYMIHLAAEYNLNKRKNVTISPLLFFEFQGDYFSASPGLLVKTRYISANSLLLFNNNGNLDVQSGFSLTREQLTIFYNFRFNIKSENSLIPFTLAHQAGLAFRLNNVEKRIKVRTINFPQL